MTGLRNTDQRPRSTPPSWWEIVRRLAVQIDRTPTLTRGLYDLVVELRDRLNEWIEQMEANHRDWR